MYGKVQSKIVEMHLRKVLLMLIQRDVSFWLNNAIGCAIKRGLSYMFWRLCLMEYQ